MAQFYDELGSLREMVDNYDKWIHTADRIADEAMENIAAARTMQGKK